jgi:hypothetical protein
MPIYLFEHVETGEIREIVYHMNEDKTYNGEGGKEKGVWKRVWLKPQMSVDAVKIDPFSSKDFVKATNKRGSLGDLFDRSAEMSAQREEKAGVDDVKEKFYKRYSAKRKGARHPQQTREIVTKKMKGIGLTAKWDD